MGNQNENYEGFRVYMAEYQTLLTEKYRKNRAWRPPDKHMVTAVIPGTILEVKVKKGQKVKAGETLVVLDAMKMENHIAMPFDGVIKRVSVKKKDIVVKNQVLLEIKA